MAMKNIKHMLVCGIKSLFHSSVVKYKLTCEQFFSASFFVQFLGDWLSCRVRLIYNVCVLSSILTAAAAAAAASAAAGSLTLQ